MKIHKYRAPITLFLITDKNMTKCQEIDYFMPRILYLIEVNRNREVLRTNRTSMQSKKRLNTLSEFKVNMMYEAMKS